MIYLLIFGEVLLIICGVLLFKIAKKIDELDIDSGYVFEDHEKIIRYSRFSAVDSLTRNIQIAIENEDFENAHILKLELQRINEEAQEENP